MKQSRHLTHWFTAPGVAQMPRPFFTAYDLTAKGPGLHSCSLCRLTERKGDTHAASRLLARSTLAAPPAARVRAAAVRTSGRGRGWEVGGGLGGIASELTALPGSRESIFALLMPE
ncbi:hypothetical protein SKAU_G00269560 [Synaphobranchus kaupii]|uniref:Uncharacterized protein n=1 Tax=Synaphobranchus kaupii TaxID=118154 RepID=A0A9Q1EZZ7_SYNKA|nr:hypothetical protein SKAU_G00269560 [Synaphobranchus kaupii]